MDHESDSEFLNGHVVQSIWEVVRLQYHFVGRGSSAGVDVNQGVVNFDELEVE
jgi:hypothetical protein